MISYEISMGLALIGVLIMAGTLNFVQIVNQQAGNFWDWYFIPQIVGFLIFFVASIAELNRTPFDIAEGEQELVAGFMTEYTGMRWGLYMFGEYINLVVMSAIISTLFLGGWRAPFDFLNFIPGFIWLIGKVIFLIFMYMWIRWTLPPLSVQPADGHRVEDLLAARHRQPGRHGHPGGDLSHGPHGHRQESDLLRDPPGDVGHRGLLRR